MYAADDPPGLEISPSLDVGGRERRRRRLVTLVVDVAAPGVATLIDSRGPAPSTDVPVTSLESRHPLRQDSTTPLWNLVLLRRVYSNGDAPCASPMNSKGLMEDGFLGGRDDWIIVLYIYIFLDGLECLSSLISITNSREIYS